MHESIQKKAINATKWSAIINILRKLISPITNMILARLLAPEIFGVVATLTMVVSFADIFTDAGLQKFLIQHEFIDEDDLYKSASVAFWTNFLLSVFLWIIIFIFKDSIAYLVGSDGYGVQLAVISISIPLLSFSSIQQAIFKRNFDFKAMFIPSIINAIIPLVITVPIAYFTHSCWSLIIGTLVANLSDAILLTLKSKWKPKFFYDFSRFKQMFAFSMWTLFEKLSVWLTLNIDIFILGNIISKYYLGLYKSGLNMVNQISNLVVAVIVPVLFSTLSRLQNDEIKYKKMFNFFQKESSIILVPMCVGMFIYRDVVTWILLGNNWMEASLLIGTNGLIQVFIILIANFASEVYRSKGKPKISFLVQIIYVLVFIPLIYYSSFYNFKILVMVRFCASVIFVCMHLIFLKLKFNFSIFNHFKNMKYPILSSMIMAIFGYFIQKLFSNMIGKSLTIILCIIIYFSVLLLFKESREDIKYILKKVGIKKKVKN